MESGEFVVVLLSIFAPHLIYILLSRGNKLISEYLYIIKNIAIWILYISIAYVYSPYLGVFFIMTYYLVNAYIITRINLSSEYFILAVMVTFFQSEFWEIPIQLFYSPPMNMWHWGIAVSRFLSIIEVVWILDSLNMDVEYFVSNLVIFGMLYYAFVILTFGLPILSHNNSITNFMYRIICSMFFFGVISIMDKKRIKISS